MGTKKRRSKAKLPGIRGPARDINLADALFSRTQQKVLGLFFGEPTRRFFASEVIDRARAGSGAVQREIGRLEKSGLITVVKVGNRKHYHANPEAPIFAELTRIVSKTFGLAEPIRQALMPLSPNILWAIIYGSVARKTDTARSDVDVLIVGDGLRLEHVFKALASVEHQLQRKINPTIMTKAEFDRRRSDEQGFVHRVVSGDYIELIGSKDAAQATR